MSGLSDGDEARRLLDGLGAYTAEVQRDRRAFVRARMRAAGRILSAADDIADPDRLAACLGAATAELSAAVAETLRAHLG